MGIFNKYRKRQKQKRIASENLRMKSALFMHRLQSTAIASQGIGISEKEKSKPIIVSLTTFDKRIDDVYLTIESIFQQSLKADKVVLWLSKEDFAPRDIPAILKLQALRGLEIEFCEKDIGPYTKFYYALKKYPNHLLITVDDDILYPADMIDQLYRAYINEPEFIHCHRAHLMRLDENMRLLPYLQWQLSSSFATESSLVFPTGVGGVIYFPGCFDDEVLNQDVFLRLSPMQDDVWLKAMSTKKGVLSKIVASSKEWKEKAFVIDGSQKVALKHKNLQSDFDNDVKIKAVFDEYDLWGEFR